MKDPSAFDPISSTSFSPTYSFHIIDLVTLIKICVPHSGLWLLSPFILQTSNLVAAQTFWPHDWFIGLSLGNWKREVNIHETQRRTPKLDQNSWSSFRQLPSEHQPSNRNGLFRCLLRPYRIELDHRDRMSSAPWCRIAPVCSRGTTGSHLLDDLSIHFFCVDSLEDLMNKISSKQGWENADACTSIVARLYCLSKSLKKVRGAVSAQARNARVTTTHHRPKHANVTTTQHRRFFFTAASPVTAAVVLFSLQHGKCREHVGSVVWTAKVKLSHAEGRPWQTTLTYVFLKGVLIFQVCGKHPAPKCKMLSSKLFAQVSWRLWTYKWIIKSLL